VCILAIVLVVWRPNSPLRLDTRTRTHLFYNGCASGSLIRLQLQLLMYCQRIYALAWLHAINSQKSEVHKTLHANSGLACFIIAHSSTMSQKTKKIMMTGHFMITHPSGWIRERGLTYLQRVCLWISDPIAAATSEACNRWCIAKEYMPWPGCTQLPKIWSTQNIACKFRTCMLHNCTFFDDVPKNKKIMMTGHFMIIIIIMVASTLG
jgi:hypothetical protein